MRSLVLVHGAGSGPWVFDGWAGAFARTTVLAIDLHQGVDVTRASMEDYAAVVDVESELAHRPLAICGWSMGGLAAMLAAQETGPDALVLLEPSPPGEVQGFDPGVALDEGLYDPEEVYGPFPEGVRARPESARARAERGRGVPVPSLPCPTLVVYGDAFPEERGRAVARFYGAEELHVPGADHWALVRDPAVREAVARWLAPRLAA